MLVTREIFESVLDELWDAPILAVDTETTGLRPYHGHVLFSIIIADSAERAFYFNFNDYPDLPEGHRLDEEHLAKLAELFVARTDRLYYLHNAKFDLAMLANEGIELVGHVHDTKAIERVCYNDLPPTFYSLDGCLKRRGDAKNDTVDLYVSEHGLFSAPDAKGKKKNPQYNRVPLHIIQPYGEDDARKTFGLGLAQHGKLADEDMKRPDEWPKIMSVVENEIALLPKVFEMERLGIQIDVPYCHAALKALDEESERLKGEFRELTGHDFKKSGVLFQELFADEQDKWGKTKKGAPSFDKNILPNFDHPAAKVVVRVSRIKGSADFFTGFLYHADENDVVHASLNQDGTNTGRFSSSNPNLQNLKKTEEGDEVDLWPVRRAIVPRKGRLLVMIDYQQLQYRLMLDYAGAMGLIEKVLGGLDVHQATADLANIKRGAAKNVNFAILFCAGDGQLSKMLKCSLLEARAVRDAVMRAAPEIGRFVRRATETAERRGFVFSFLGRRYDIPRKLAYTATNKIIQGGEAELVKIAMNRAVDRLRGMQTKLILTIHDELVFEAVEEELPVFAEIQQIMCGAYSHRHLPLAVDVSHSYRSLHDKVKGLPDGCASRHHGKTANQHLDQHA